MAWSPVAPLEVFSEALSVPAWIHTTPAPAKVLVVGNYATALAALALRYPTAAEVFIVGDCAPPADKRAKVIRRLADLPEGWKADVASLALPGTPAAMIQAMRAAMAPEGVATIAVDVFSKGRSVKDDLREQWRHVLPYREHTPDPALFFLVSDRKLGTALRPWPQGLKRLAPAYLSSLFTLAKDEYQFLFGGA